MRTTDIVVEQTCRYVVGALAASGDGVVLICAWWLRAQYFRTAHGCRSIVCRVPIQL